MIVRSGWPCSYIQKHIIDSAQGSRDSAQGSRDSAVIVILVQLSLNADMIFGLFHDIVIYYTWGKWTPVVGRLHIFQPSILRLWRYYLLAFSRFSHLNDCSEIWVLFVKVLTYLPGVVRSRRTSGDSHDMTCGDDLAWQCPPATWSRHPFFLHTSERIHPWPSVH